MLATSLVLIAHDRSRRGLLINVVALPFVGFAVVLDRRIERCITAEPPVHVNDILLRDIEALRDRAYLIGMQIASFERPAFPLCRAHLPEKLLLVCRTAAFPKRPP